MKKILLLTLSIYFLASSFFFSAYAAGKKAVANSSIQKEIQEQEFEDIILNSEKNSIENKTEEREKDLLEGEHEVILETPIILEKENPWSKEGLKGAVEQDFNLNSTDGLLKKQLTAEFEHGPIKSMNLQGNFIFTLGDTINKNDNDFKYNTQLINIGVKGKFRSEKEGYNSLKRKALISRNFRNPLINAASLPIFATMEFSIHPAAELHSRTIIGSVLEWTKLHKLLKKSGLPFTR